MDDFLDILNKHRQVYIRQLLEFYKERTEGARELLLKMNSEKEDLLFDLSRMDYLLKDNEDWKIEELSPDTFANHRPIGFSFGKMQIELNPIYWHGCQFVINKQSDDIEWLKSWTLKWIDEDELIPKDNDGLTGAIHNVTTPTIDNGAITFTVDLGTASVDSVIELVELIKQTGTDKLVINSFDLMDNE